MTHSPGSDPPLDRRALLRHLAALGLLTSPAVGSLTACADRDDGPAGMGDGMPDWMMGDGMMDGQMMTDMPVIHDLLTGHNNIHREVQDVDGGIRSHTTSSDPQLAGQIRTHV